MEILQYYSRVWWVSHLTGLLSFLNGLLLRERLRLESKYVISLCLLPIRVWLLKTNTHIQLKTGSKSHRWDHLCLVKCCGPVFPPGPPFNFGPILWHIKQGFVSVLNQSTFSHCGHARATTYWCKGASIQWKPNVVLNQEEKKKVINNITLIINK